MGCLPSFERRSCYYSFYNAATRLAPRQFFARDTFVRTNCCTIAMMFLRLFVTGMHCDHTVHFSMDLSLRLDSPMFWTPCYPSTSTYSQPSLPSSIWERGGVWMWKLGNLGCRLLHPHHALSLSTVTELLVEYGHLKEKAQWRDKWGEWCIEPAFGQRT